MWLLVCVGIMLDVLIVSTGDRFGFRIPNAFIISIILTVWLFINEIISILENVMDIGVEMPSFLLPLVKNIRGQVEDKANETVGQITNGKGDE